LLSLLGPRSYLTVPFETEFPFCHPLQLPGLQQRYSIPPPPVSLTSCRPLQLAGLQRRYSIPPPHGSLTSCRPLQLTGLQRRYSILPPRGSLAAASTATHVTPHGPNRKHHPLSSSIVACCIVVMGPCIVGSMYPGKHI
jgi:hypothetical protein